MRCEMSNVQRLLEKRLRCVPSGLGETDLVSTEDIYGSIWAISRTFPKLALWVPRLAEEGHLVAFAVTCLFYSTTMRE
jgi:hypothetical protein